MIITQEDYPTPDVIQHPELAPDQTGKWLYLASLASQPGAMQVIIEIGALAYPLEPSHN
ncbi:MAG: hypothetical protein ABIR37_04250 [Candidatus Saccharimonadales bacterium]